MTPPITADIVARALAEAVTQAFAQRAGVVATFVESPAPAAAGWQIRLDTSGSVRGAVTIWLDRAAATAAVKDGGDPQADVAVAEWWRSTITAAVLAPALRLRLTGVTFGAPELSVVDAVPEGFAGVITADRIAIPTV